LNIITRLSRNSALLLIAIIAVHVGLWILGSTIEADSTGDVEYSYKLWVDALHVNGKWGGINAVWVYPFVAWIPMLLAKILVFTDYKTAWLAIASLLNIFAIGQLIGWGRRPQNYKAAWYFLAFIAALGPVAISRLDGISVSIALLGVASLQVVSNSNDSFGKISLRSNRALIWFTVVAWMKVWTVALVIGLLSTKETLRRQLWVIASTCGVIIAFAALLGANLNLFSFIWFQSNRGLQIESPIANIWVWLTALKSGDSLIYFDNMLITWQVSGPGDALVSTLMGLAMLVAISITGYLIWQGHKSGVEVTRLASLGALTATLDLIVFNKVGSPQYQIWITVPVVMGLYFGLKNWRVPVIATLLLAALTQVIYPIMYTHLVVAEILPVWVLTARNLILIALLVWSNIQLGKKPSENSAV